MTYLHIIGLALTLILVLALSIYSGKSVKKAKDANSFLVSGAILGTLIGGSSTVGTAQLAYMYGMSAWWFTLGGGIACLILALFYARPFLKSGNKTIMAFIRNEYGESSGLWASSLSSVGSFINIISQLISATAVISVVFPSLPLAPAVLFSGVFMILYIIFGGNRASGMVGILKTLLISIAMLVGGWIVLKLSGGFNGFFNIFKTVNEASEVNMFSLFSRGVGVDLGACLSLILGVITTQSYASALLMTSKTKNAVKGALAGAVIMPVIGIMGILIGIFMKDAHPGIVAKTALTMFVTEYMHPLFAGVTLGALFITVVGTGAGLALGISSVIKNDILPAFKKKPVLSDILIERVLIVIILLLASLLSMGPLGDTILIFAFMSMGLRGATVFIPLCSALWLRGKIENRYALISIILSPLLVLVFGLWGELPFDALFIGVFASFIIMAFGFIKSKKERL